MSYIIFSILLLALNVRCESPTIKLTANGPVEGIEQTTSLGQKYYAFKGIPFAEPPITGIDPYTGEHVDRRFKPTEPLKRRWTEPLNAHHDGKSCFQSPTLAGISPDELSVSEDCLFLNVYIPATGAKQKTVLLFIHGGAFVMGDAKDSMLGPDFLLSEDNIVVKIQYRVGSFGFLKLDDDTYTGNMGLKDQQLALKWVYENIENFSGKKDEILLFGISAGGASVHYHMVNEISRKYFNRAFAMSSSVFSEYAMRKANHVQQIQECTQIYDMDKLIEYLKSANSSVFDSCYKWAFPGYLDPIWVPTIESPNAIEPFLTKPIEEIYSSDEAPQLDAMFSFASQEVISFLPHLLKSTEPLIKEDYKKTDVKLPFEGFTKDAYPKEYAKAVEILRLAYFPDVTTIDAIRHANVALMSDLTMSDGILKAAVLQAEANNKNPKKSGPKNTFLYRFAVHSDLSMMKILVQNKYTDAAHGDDMCYIFQCNAFNQLLSYEKHLQEKNINYDIIRRLMKIITNFARTGDPSIEGDTPFRSCQSSDKMYCQEILNDPKSYTTFDIKEQLHYNAWREVEEIYNSLGIMPHKSKEDRPLKVEL